MHHCSRLVARFAVLPSVLVLIACASSSSPSSSTSTSTTPTITPVSLVPTASGTDAGPAVTVSVTQSGSSFTTGSIGNPEADILTLVIPTSSNSGETATLSSTALGGGGPIALAAQGTGTQSGLTSQNYQGSFTYNSTTYNFTVSDVGATANLSYSTFGQWNITPSGSTTATASLGFYSVGSPTPAANVPTTGSATYTGGALGVASLNSSSTSYLFSGIATLNAVFSSGTISGAITGINAYSGQTNSPAGTLNDIDLTGGTISGNGFAGSASTSSTAGTAANFSGATGSFRGNFFGPAAQEAGGTFNLTNTTTTGTTTTNALISGSFGAHR